MPIFNLKKPCLHCPFRRSCLKGWLGADRAAGIIRDMLRDDTIDFPCHETTDATGYKGQPQLCGGGMILLDKLGSPSVKMRLGMALQQFDIDALGDRDDVFDTALQFVEHHRSERLDG